MAKKISVAFLILASLTMMFFSERPFYFALPLWGLFVALCYFDFKTLKLPNILTGAVLVWGIAYTTISGIGVISPLISFSIALTAFLLISIFYKMIRGKQGLGMGDVKLFAAGAVWLNPIVLPIMMLISSIGAILYATPKLMTKKSGLSEFKIPFGPFIAIAIWICWLFEDEILLLLS